MPPTKKQKLIVVVGPTASGKTGLAVALAKRFDGEVISADSRQVYRELVIGTEKVTKREMQGIPHHCLAMASPRRAYSAAAWAACARRAVNDIESHARVPIVAGGTGFYIDALLYFDTLPEVKPNAALRRKLDKKSAAELFAMLKKLDPERAHTIERENPRRLIRAIEIAHALGSTPPLPDRISKYEVLFLGLLPAQKTLEERISRRLTRALRKGLVAEVRRLREGGLSWKRLNELGLEYRIASQYLRGEISKEEMRDRMYHELKRYAKRQIRWFKRNKAIHWFVSPEDKHIVSLVKKFFH